MVNERTPADPLPADFVPEGAVATHRVSDGEDWASLAEKYNVEVDDLTFFNFHTNNTDEINWYLRRNVGCGTSRDGGVNWAFSSSAYPGLIYIPPSAVIEMDEEVITVYKPVLQRCQEIAASFPGREGKRIRKMLSIVIDQDSPALLWFYNPGLVSFYIDLNHSNEDRRAMTHHTNGEFPFDGDAGPGWQYRPEWRLFPFSEIIVRDTNAHQSDAALKIWLEGTEASIFQSWEEMAGVQNRFGMGGGSALSPLVVAFLKHVYDLADLPDHIYYIYQHDE